MYVKMDAWLRALRPAQRKGEKETKRKRRRGERERKGEGEKVMDKKF